MSDKSDNDPKEWAFKHLERFAIFVCTGAMAVGSLALWENWKFNQRATVIMEQLQANDNRQDAEIAEIKGKMLTWDMLKRIELMLSAFPESERGQMINEAIRIELEGRREKRGR